jgi:CheY-like chemotaxis protein
MDGYELGRRLASAFAENAPKMIAITGYGQAADRHRSTEAGFDEHLVKPINLEQLQRVIESLYET